MNILEIIEKLNEKWEKTVVQFFGSLHSVDKFQSIGTGFLVNYRNHILLVSAFHVLKILEHCKAQRFVKINDQFILLTNIHFIYDEGNDIAFIQINKFTNFQEKLSKVSLINMDDESTTISLGVHMILGYPSSKNKQYLKVRKFNTYCLCISGNQITYDSPPKTYVQDPIYIEFNKKEQINSQMKKISNVPNLSGMSGGPVFELCQKIKKHHLQYSIILRGIFVEQTKSPQSLVASPVKYLINLIDNEIKGASTY